METPLFFFDHQKDDGFLICFGASPSYHMLSSIFWDAVSIVNQATIGGILMESPISLGASKAHLGAALLRLGRTKVREPVLRCGNVLQLGAWPVDDV